MDQLAFGLEFDIKVWKMQVKNISDWSSKADNTGSGSNIEYGGLNIGWTFQPSRNRVQEESKGNMQMERGSSRTSIGMSVLN